MLSSRQKNISFCSVIFSSLRTHGLYLTKLCCPWNSPGEYIGVGCLSILQGIFPNQGSNPGLLHCRQILYHLSQQGSPLFLSPSLFIYLLSICVSIIYLREGNGTPLQYSCLENPWMEGPGRLQSMGSLGVGCYWATSLSLFTFMHWRRKWQPTPVFLPGESQGQRSLMGCRLWGRTESDTTEAT